MAINGYVGRPSGEPRCAFGCLWSLHDRCTLGLLVRQPNPTNQLHSFHAFGKWQEAMLARRMAYGHYALRLQILAKQLLNDRQ